MAKRLLQLESIAPLKKLTTSFKPNGCTSSAAILLIDDMQNKVCMVTKRKKIDWGGQTVFPGGLIDNSDGKLVNYIQKYCSAYVNKYNFVFDDLMYRVNALRELFEETGILLCRNINELDNENIIYPIKTQMYSFNDNDSETIDLWRRKVLEDPYEFELLHRSIGTIPDILSMIPWARLRTPWRTGRRWDTRFFLSCIDTNEIKENVIHPLGREIVSIDWINISDESQQKLRFPPPTMMKLKELNIICNKENALLDEYKNGFFTRNVKAVRPKLAMCPDTKKIMILWNRDYMYDALDVGIIECNQEYENNVKNIHRIYFSGPGKMEVVLSYDRMYEYRKNNSIMSKL
eukprot:456138_1